MSRRLSFLLGLLLCLGSGLLTPLSAMSVQPPSFTKLVGSADSIVLGTVSDVSSRWVTNDAGHRLIKTFVTLRVLESPDSALEKHLTLSFLGGTVGVDSMRVGGMPTFTKGDKAWFFVRDNGKALCPLNFATHGAYPVVHDPATDTERVTRLNGVPLTSPADVSEPLHAETASSGHSGQLARALTSSDFSEAIRAELEAIDRQQRILP